MRVDFCAAIDKVLELDPRSLLVSGDLGYSAFEKVQARHGKRFLNAGVAEQNMMGVAAGLALSGFRPWVYSIAPFATFRCLEQIRNDVCLHCLPVRIVGNGGGYTYGVQGTTHHALEDLGVLKGLPNLQLFFPCANDQVAAAVGLMSELERPSYLRLGVSPYTTAWEPLSENSRTLTRHYHAGNALTLLTVGHATQIALAALQRCALGQLGVDLFAMARFPFAWDADAAVVESIRKTQRVVVLEEHYACGGMGESLQASVPCTVPFTVLAPFYRKGHRYGSAAYHLTQCGLSPEQCRNRIAEILANHEHTFSSYSAAA
jgi:transketolase